MYLSSLAFSLFLLALLVEDFDLSPVFANIIVIACTTVTNFTGCRYLVYNEKLRNSLSSLEAYLLNISNLYPVFIGGCFIKVLAVTWSSSPLLNSHFSEFIHHYIFQSGNPYIHFFNENFLDVFPYSSGMLWVFSLPILFITKLFGSSLEYSPWFYNYAMKSVLFLFDFALFITLGRLFPKKIFKLGMFYWLNPIVIYSTYIHGQLDIIPCFFLFISIFVFMKKQVLISYILFIFSLSCKAHVLLALPFLLVYSYFNSRKKIKTFFYFLLVFFGYLVLQAPFLSEEFFHLVWLEEQKLKIFSLFVNYSGVSEIKFLFLPSIFCVIYFYYFIKRKILSDYLFYYIGISFSLVLILTKSEPAWHLWSLPFFTYFLMRFSNKDFDLGYVIYCLSYLLYMIFSLEYPFDIIFDIINIKTNKLMINLSFTIFNTSQIILLFLLVHKFRDFVKKPGFLEPYRIGISGDSGSGKTTISSCLKDLFHFNDSQVIYGDDLHKWERGHSNWQRFTHLNPFSNHLHLDIKHLDKIRENKLIERRHYNHQNGYFTEAVNFISKRFTIFEGLHTLYLKRMRDNLNLKIFVEPDEKLRIFWKIKRDMKKRGYSFEKSLEQINHRKKDALIYIKTQRCHADIIISWQPVPTLDNIEPMILAQSDIEVYLRLYLNLDIDIENFIYMFEQFAPQMKVVSHVDLQEHTMIPCDFKGQISKSQMNKIFSQMIEKHEEYFNYLPNLSSGYLGIIQLAVVYYLISS